MELIRGIHNIKPWHRGCVLSIGNFDGVHLGHQAVLRGLVEQARRLGVPACVMVFEPQPQELFAGKDAPARLTRLREKYARLAELGIDRLLCVRFTAGFAAQSPDDFIRGLLVNRLGVRFLVVGDDFRFGRNRGGDFKLLTQAGRAFDFEVVSTQSWRMENRRVSSTLIRQALADDRLDEAARMLGRPFSLCGRVAHGAKLGRTIGFPTANVALKRRVIPVSGVYAVRLSVEGRDYAGVANVGHKPTVNGTRALLEVHLFDFAGDLYGKQVDVALCHKLRNEQKFASFALLKEQIQRDAVRARQWFGLAVSEPNGM
ncbi:MULTISPECIES: bifunctional riboflavin kinase/FAD synthetase [Oceanimonas]|uniref:Riboflavin biosynthesis protein n=1 Tax=Oceanimonas doudoroffii TaxID=84158 RepID=A0A233RCI0_9GAMM|nr:MULTISPECIES: bifunctional riboflavin kinase/FAD synthetase [Oceanimonas]NHI00954.1 Riboflavin biosynthesis protein RibF [Oceanimonas sp. MB9]OXY81081.1 riboflavin biosynthesis protein RibF [Oceanimonas doudoroffii]